MMFTQPVLHLHHQPRLRRDQPGDAWCAPATSPTPTGPTTATSRSPPTAAPTGSRAPSRAGSTAAARSPPRPTAAGSSGRPATRASASSTRSASATPGPPSTGIPANAIGRVRPGRTRTSSTASAAARSTSAPTAAPRFTADRGDRPADHRHVQFKAVPGREGDIWLAGGATGLGLWRSTDSGASFTKLADVQRGRQRRLRQGGARADLPGAVHSCGTVDGVNGRLPLRRRRRDLGARSTTTAHQYGNTGEAITGDPRVYGRVYLGTNGRGILVADRTGGDARRPRHPRRRHRPPRRRRPRRPRPRRRRPRRRRPPRRRPPAARRPTG